MLEEESGLELHHSLPAEPRELQWLYPEQVVQMLQEVAELLQLDLARNHGKPLPNRHYREIIGWFVGPLLVEHGPEQRRAAFRKFSRQDQAYFIYLLRMALIDVMGRQASLPNVPLGVPADKLGTWSNLLARSWLPLPQNLRYKLR
jgi:hypothetical protein